MYYVRTLELVGTAPATDSDGPSSRGLTAAPESNEVVARLSAMVVDAARRLGEWLWAGPQPAGPTRPWTAAYRPSWVMPSRQSSIYVYVFLPDAREQVAKEAHSALDAPQNPAKESTAIALSRTLEDGEMLAVEVKLPGFSVGEPEPQPWHGPSLRFVVPILGHPGTAIGIHRPLVTLRGGNKELLATFDFDLELRHSPKPSLVQSTTTAVAAAVAAVAAVIIAAELHDRTVVYASYATQDIERVKRAAKLLQADGRFPSTDIESILSQPRAITDIEHAHRFFLFWSHNAESSYEVTNEWQGAVATVPQKNPERGFLMPVLLDHNRPSSDHPLARFEPIDLGSLVDVLIVTAVPEEYDAVRAVETGASTGTAWVERTGPAGLQVAFCEFTTSSGDGVLRFAVTQALGMAGVNAVLASAELIQPYNVRCLAMCGVCAGRRGDVELGDVIIADRLWQYDTGKHKATVNPQGQRIVHHQADINMYKIRPNTWIQTAERFTTNYSPGSWLSERPLSFEAQGDWILERLYHDIDPATDQARPTSCPDYAKAWERLWKKNLVKPGTTNLTDSGRAHIYKLLIMHANQLPRPRPFNVHIGPIASGNNVMEDHEIFSLLADSVRKVKGVEMEAAAIAALADRAELEYSVVMKGVMDHADDDKSDNFKAFAARASAECLVAFLRQSLPPRKPPIP